MPNARVFCLQPNLYARRQSLLPCGGTRRCKPPPSESLNGFVRGSAFRTAVSLRGMLVSSPSPRGDTNQYTNDSRRTRAAVISFSRNSRLSVLLPNEGELL